MPPFFQLRLWLREGPRGEHVLGAVGFVALLASVNKSGGVACGRKLVIKQYDVNPIDPNDGQSKCLQMVQDRPFAIVDYAGFVTPASRSCFVQAKIPLETSTSIGETEVKS